jgi:hypothetical protein
LLQFYTSAQKQQVCEATTAEKTSSKTSSLLQLLTTVSANYQLRLGDLSLLCKLEILMEEQSSGVQKAAIVISQCYWLLLSS